VKTLTAIQISKDYSDGEEQMLLLVSKTRYDIIEEAELEVDKDLLMQKSKMMLELE
jgi:hypothetical protein